MRNLPMKINTAEENAANRQIVVDNWNLGPVKTSSDNSDYWNKYAEAMRVDVAIAKTMLCANCEYFNNTSDMMLQMNKIPIDKFDLDGGGRGYCHEFDFICHNLRTCQKWEGKEFYLMDDAPVYAGEMY